MPGSSNRGPRKPPADKVVRNKRTSSKRDLPKGHLIVIVHAWAKVRANRDGVPIADAADVSTLTNVFAPSNVNLISLFGLPEERLRRESRPRLALTGSDGSILPDLSLFYRVDAPSTQLCELVEQIRQNEAFEAAYIKPFTELPQFTKVESPSTEEPPTATPDFTALQGYLDPAPMGVDARYAWTLRGGDGNGVGIIDIEGAWRFSHECLNQRGGLVGGIQETDITWRNNGTAVLGIMGGAHKGFGVMGICPGASICAISHSGPGQTTSAAIRQAADLLSPGDIILLNTHRPGPQSPKPYETNRQQLGFIPIEWWPDDFVAIDYAVRKGIIVVEAAGNGGVSLDHPIYDQDSPAVDRFGPFPAWWQNPFRRRKFDSGAILVGAGAPPSGEFGPDRSWLMFSNYGSPVDAQGWGAGVVSSGYGDLQGGMFEDLWYTKSFSGTSSAAPMVVGALACLQGAIKSTGGALLTSPKARELLRDFGSDQIAIPGQPKLRRIGKRPDLKTYLEIFNIGTKTDRVDPDSQQDEHQHETTGAAEKCNGLPIAIEQDFGAGPTPVNDVPLTNGVEAHATERLAKIETRLDQLARFIGVHI